MLEFIAALMICIAALSALILLSVRADHRFRHLERLPMQWSLQGKPTWSAPRKLALAFTPGLAAVILTAVVVSVATLEPHPGQEGLEIPVVFLVALSLVATHLFHLWMLDRKTGPKD
ncbi:hypothetical protein [Novosphingobium aquimarinum]|uniref:hypothetical protein n=1 Tax=Novosphingobium aquimarinum TaxID=2682494 RepID=UPI0012EC0D58|nr:hypothetical protein [Novosphingobium aquimarinum]